MSLHLQLLCLLCSSAVVLNAENLGKWSPTINFNLVPAAVALSPPTNEMVCWASYRGDVFQGTMDRISATYTATYNLQDGSISNKMITDTNHDMFCPAIAQTFDGSIMVMGGNTWGGLTSIYSGGSWAAGKKMTINRAYSSAATTSTGTVFTIGGSWGSAQGSGVKVGEQWDPVTNTWKTLPGCLVEPMYTDDMVGSQLFRRDAHAWLVAWKRGSVFQAGPSRAMNWYFTAGDGDFKAAGIRDNTTDAMCGNAVLYDAVAGKIFTAGGAPKYSDSFATRNAHVITIDEIGATPDVRNIGPMNHARSYVNSVIMPDGKLFIVGGQTYARVFNDDNSVLVPEMWDPETGNFTDLAAGPTPRNYHSVALLMPDATVFSGGGGLEASCNCNHMDGEFYSPPYLFEKDGQTNATRPEIDFVFPVDVEVGGILTVTLMSPPKGKVTFSMIRTGTSTHTVNTDQRFIRLTTSATDSPYDFQLPDDPGVCLPGYWMVFALDDGVPSMGEFVKVLPADEMSRKNPLLQQRSREEGNKP